MVRRKREAGFTLVEILIVIVILALLAGIIVPKMTGAPEKARVAKAKVQIKQLEASLNMFKIDSGFFPTTEQGLEALVEKPTVGEIPKNYRKGGYIKKIPNDPWGSEYIYLAPGEHDEFDLISYGRDGEEGGEEGTADINNWEIE